MRVCYEVKPTFRRIGVSLALASRLSHVFAARWSLPTIPRNAPLWPTNSPQTTGQSCTSSRSGIVPNFLRLLHTNVNFTVTNKEILTGGINIFPGTKGFGTRRVHWRNINSVKVRLLKTPAIFLFWSFCLHRVMFWEPLLFVQMLAAKVATKKSSPTSVRMFAHLYSGTCSFETLFQASSHGLSLN